MFRLQRADGLRLGCGSRGTTTIGHNFAKLAIADFPDGVDQG